MKYTNNFNIPQSLCDAIKVNTYDLTQTDQNVISVTTLSAPPRVRQLSIRHWDDIEADVSDSFWTLMGSAVHEVVSRISKKDRIIEERMEEEILGIKVSGKPDLYDIKEKSIQDYKFTSVWAVKKDKIEWENQLNCYCWLLRKRGYEVTDAYINALLKDWRNSEFIRNPGEYPPIPYKKVIINLWSIEEQQKFVEDRVKLHKSYVEEPDDKLPLCSEVERWTTETKWAVYKNENKTASRVLSSELEAGNWIEEAEEKDKKPNKYKIVKRDGIDKKCAGKDNIKKGYCSCANFCDYWLNKYGSIKEKS